MQDLYADIRPYDDSEVAAVLRRLLSSEDLQRAVLRYRFSRWPEPLYRLFLPIARLFLRYQLRHVRDIADFQRWMSGWVDVLLEKTSSHIEVRGLEHLEPGTAYLWLSNHRDIAMDPTLINYALMKSNWPTSRIAIGDNLLGHPDVADIMRLNKSFVVKRALGNSREKLRELQKLSSYIRQSIDDGHSVWIAHREGRAKDGIDETDTAVLKMLALNGRAREEDFATTMQQLHPVPVCIQYEWDPCDISKATELVTLAKNGRYSKAEGEDTRSIILGLTGFKGHIIVDFGKPLSAQELQTADTMAHAIDSQLERMRAVSPIHRTALALLKNQYPEFKQFQGEELDLAAATELEQRLRGQPSDVCKRLLMTYAMPLMRGVEDVR